MSDTDKSIVEYLRTAAIEELYKILAFHQHHINMVNEEIERRIPRKSRS